MRKRYTLEDCNKYAKKFNCECLSDCYSGIMKKMKWKCCICKEEWFLSFYSFLIRKNKCKLCNLKYSINDLRIFALTKGGKLLSNCNNNKKIKTKDCFEWECCAGHKFIASFSYVKNHRIWCSKCSSGLYERIVKEYFEQLFNNKFPKIRPEWLISPKTGYRLELDGYCMELGIAFEHNGGQHYKQLDWFNKANFNDIKYNDRIKEKLCIENNVVLISIPELFKYTKLESLKDLIKKECLKNNIIIPENYDNMVVNLLKAYSFSEKDKLIEIKKIASKNKITCISKYYAGVSVYLDFKCDICDFKWKSTPANIKHGSGCSKCACKKNAESKKFKYFFIKNFIEQRGGILLSKEYFGTKEKIKIKCNECENIWESSFDNIKRGCWCNNKKCNNYGIWSQRKNKKRS